jgi:plastocyanin
VNRHLWGALLTSVLLTGCGGGSSDKDAEPASSSSTTASSGPTAAGAPSGTGDAVTAKLFTFSPTPLGVKAGTKVTWTNDDQILHTVTSGSPPGSGDGAFNGQMDGKGTSFAFTFERPGTYKYFCMRHNQMTAQVDVS